jgi:hypothetical protein
MSEDEFEEGSSESDESDWSSDAVDEEQHKETDDEGLEHEGGAYAEMYTTSSDDSIRVEFLELLFQLSMTLSKQEFLDGDAGSTLLVYFSGILGFSSDFQHFMLARQFCPSLSGLIYVQRLLFLEYALPLFGYRAAMPAPDRPARALQGGVQPIHYGRLAISARRVVQLAKFRVQDQQDGGSALSSAME